MARRRIWVVRDGAKFLQEREPVVGFTWQSSGRAWLSAAQYASKYTRRRDAQRAAEAHGGQVERACLPAPRGVLQYMADAKGGESLEFMAVAAGVVAVALMVYGNGVLHVGLDSTVTNVVSALAGFSIGAPTP